MFNIYILKDWKGFIHLMHASKIHQRVIEDSTKSNYGWIAAATDLIKVCKKKDFPTEYATDIKIAILNCFSETIYDVNARQKETDYDAVYFAYNSLYELQEENKKVFEARAKFLYSYIKRKRPSAFYHHGNSYDKFCEDWQISKFIEYIVKENINFEELYSILWKDFHEKMKLEEEKGTFIEDDYKHQQKEENFFKDFISNFSPVQPLIRVLK